MEVLGLIAIGILAGILSGLMGIGGATIIIPSLTLLFKTTQHMAQGIALGAMLLPVGILAAAKYHQAGNLNIKFAALIAIGFLVGGYFGAGWVTQIPEPLLKKVFAAYLIVIALQLMFG